MPLGLPASGTSRNVLFASSLWLERRSERYMRCERHGQVKSSPRRGGVEVINRGLDFFSSRLGLAASPKDPQAGGTDHQQSESVSFVGHGRDTSHDREV